MPCVVPPRTSEAPATTVTPWKRIVSTQLRSRTADERRAPRLATRSSTTLSPKMEQREDAEHHVVGPVAEPGVTHDLVRRAGCRASGRPPSACRPSREEQRRCRQALHDGRGQPAPQPARRQPASRRSSPAAPRRRRVPSKRARARARPPGRRRRTPAAAGPDHRHAGRGQLALELGRRLPVEGTTAAPAPRAIRYDTT